MSELNDLRTRLHETWMEKEQERAATDLHDFSGVFPAVGELIDQCTKAALSYLGQEVAPGETTAQLAGRLRDVVADHPAALPSEADMDWYLLWMDKLVLDAEAIDHFRSSYSGDWKKAYKGVLPNKVGWDASNAFVRLFNAFDGDFVRKVEKRVPRDAFRQAFDSVVEALDSASDPPRFMELVLTTCRKLVVAEFWGEFDSLGYAEDVALLTPFLSEVPDEPLPEDVESLWFSIGYPVRDDGTVAEAEVFGFSSYEPGSDAFEREPPSYDSRLSLESKVLAQIYRLCQKEDDPDVRNFAEYVLLLAWTAFLAREVTRNYADERGKRFGAIAGFHDGDWVDLGWIGPGAGRG